jgi:hypothetical protein
MSDLSEDELRLAAMRADLLLKTRQARWETPKAVAMVLQFQQPLRVQVTP